MSEQVGARRGTWSPLVYWTLAVTGLGLFALGALASPYCLRADTRRQLACEERKVEKVRRIVEHLSLKCEALSEDPRYLARQIRQDLGYRRPGEQPLPFTPEGVGAPAAVVEAPVTRMETVCRLFRRPVIRQASLVGGLMILAIAMVWFDMPTRSRRTKHTG